MRQKQGMVATAADLPDDIATLKAMVIAGLEREARMQHILDQIRRTTFGKKSEKLRWTTAVSDGSLGIA